MKYYLFASMKYNGMWLNQEFDNEAECLEYINEHTGSDIKFSVYYGEQLILKPKIVITKWEFAKD